MVYCCVFAPAAKAPIAIVALTIKQRQPTLTITMATMAPQRVELDLDERVSLDIIRSFHVFYIIYFIITYKTKNL